MKLLLDTHVLLWWLENPGHLSKEVRNLIANSDNAVYVSAAVVWEIVIKRSIGKLFIPDNLDAVLVENNFIPLPISHAHALAVAKLPKLHKDPFDRMLVAQSEC